MTGNLKRRDEAGITLVEILICVVVVGVLTATLGALFGTTLRGTASVTQKVNESNDAQLIATFLNRDAQAVGGINPNTGITDPTLGISTSDADSCTGTGALVVRFKWKDLAPTPVTYRASYFYDSATKSLTRVLCSGSNTTLELGRKVASATTACTPSCTGIPVDVALTVTETNVPANAPTAYQYTLKAAVRPEAKSSVPSSLNAGVVPLIALGGVGTCPALSIQGTGEVEVMGSVIVNATNSGNCTAVNVGSNAELELEAPNTELRILQGGTCGPSNNNGCPDNDEITSYSPAITDPLAGAFPVPSNTCGSGSNPPLSGGKYSAGTYPTPLSVNGNVTFNPGVYVLCNGISFASNANVIGSGVFFYLPNGTLSFSGQPTINLSAPSSGPYKGVLFWQVGSTTMPITGGATINTYAGIIYAPAATVAISGGAGTSVGAIIAKAITIAGNSENIFGPVPLSISGPLSLADATYNVAYTPATFTTKGGSGGVTWTATNVPPGMSLDSVTGILSGTPTWNPTKVYSMSVTATDNSGGTVTVGRNIRVVAPPKPMSIELKNSGKPGSTAGKVEQGDQIIVTYSELMAVDTFCPGNSGWSNDNVDQAIDGSNEVTVTLTNGSGNNSDTISFTAAGCSGGFNFNTTNNTLTLGNKDFTTATRTFGGNNVADRSTIDWDHTNFILTITLGKVNSNGGIATQNTPTTVTYTPDSVLDSSLGVGIIGTVATGNVKQF